MPDSVRTYLESLWSTLRPADLLDILVVAIFVYGTITWFRRSQSRFVLTGFAALVLIYFGAKLFDMYLTLFLFQVGITVAAVAVVVVFQEEIRRAFERIATGSLFLKRARAVTAAETVDILVEASANLANNKTGALVVLRGKEPLERHLTGGVPLDGRLSEPLMYSIFDPSSAGHDGAVVLEGSVVTRFAAHLPLSTNVGGHEKFGTRHTAALGLSERSDALVVVVSEERGVISVAQGGQLETLKSAAELKQRLDTFTAARDPEPPTGPLRSLFTQNLGTKALSVAVALVAWLVVFGYQNEVVARTYSVPIVFRNVPEGWMIDEPDPHEARVTLSGSTRAFRLLEADTMAVSLDIATPRNGWQQVEISETDLSHPGDLTVQSLEPQVVRFTASPTTKVSVPVRPRTGGKLPRGVGLKQVRAKPEKVELVVRKSDKPKIRAVPTERVDLTGIETTTSVPVSLEPPQHTRLIEPDEKVTVTVEVVPRKRR